jgi:hypothetical protein
MGNDRRAGRVRRALRAGAGVAALAVALGGCIQELAVPPGFDSAYAADVDAHGTILATASAQYGGGERAWAFVRPPGQEAWQPLGTPDDWASLTAHSIDDSGTAVGTAWDDPNLPFSTTAVMWDEAGGLRPLDGVPADWRASVGGAISGNGDHVIGEAQTGAGESRSFVLHRPSGTTAYLPLLAGTRSTHAEAVNDAGTVVGVAPGDPTRGIAWSGPDGEAVALLPITRGAEVAVSSIDDDGTIVGYEYGVPAGVPARGIRWAPAAGGYVAESLGSFTPHDIEDGTMVGYVPLVEGEFDSEAAWWPPGADAPERLGRPRGGRSSAEAIRGDEIVGWALDGDGSNQRPARFAPTP